MTGKIVLSRKEIEIFQKISCNVYIDEKKKK